MTEGQMNRLIELLESIAISLSDLEDTIWNLKEDLNEKCLDKDQEE